MTSPEERERRAKRRNLAAKHLRSDPFYKAKVYDARKTEYSRTKMKRANDDYENDDGGISR